MITLVYPAIFFGIVIICIVCYKVSEALDLQIQDKLAERRKQYAKGV